MSQETKRTVVRVGAVVLLWVYITVFGVQPFLPHVTDKMLLVVLFFAGALTWAAATKKETAKTAAWVWAAFAILNLFTTFLGLPDTPFRQLSDGCSFSGCSELHGPLHGWHSCSRPGHNRRGSKEGKRAAEHHNRKRRRGMTENGEYKSPWWADSDTMAQYVMLAIFGYFSVSIIHVILLHGFMPVRELMPWIVTSIYGIANFVVLLPKFRRGRKPLAIIQGVVAGIGFLLTMGVAVAVPILESWSALESILGIGLGLFFMGFIGGWGQAFMHHAPDPIGGPLKPKTNGA